MRKKYMLILVMLMAMPQVWSQGFGVVTESGHSIALDIYSDEATMVGFDAPLDGGLIIPEQVEYEGVSYPVTAISCDFNNQTGLTSITLPATIKEVSMWGLWSCSNLNQLNFEGSIEQWLDINFNGDGNPLSYAHHLYMDGQEVENLVIPEGITLIKDYAFDGCKGLATVTFPSTLDSIGNYAFANCDLLSRVYCPSIEDWCKIGFGNNWSNPLSYAHRLYLGGQLQTTLDIPAEVERVKDYAFYNINYVNQVVLHDGLRSIGRYAFETNDCPEINEIPASVDYIGEGAINPCGKTIHYRATHCTTIESNYINGSHILAIGANVEWLPRYLITSNAYKIIMQGNPPAMANYALDAINPSAVIVVPCGMLSEYQTAAGWEEYANQMQENMPYTISLGTMEHGYAWISEEATCTQPAVIFANPEVNYTFSRWSDGNTDNPRTIMPTQDTHLVALFAAPTCISMTGGIEACYVPNGSGMTLTSITGQIQGSFTVPDSVMFDGEMKPVNVIGEGAFNNQTAMSILNLHVEIDSIGYGAFGECSGLARVNYSGTIADWCHIGFGDVWWSNPLGYAHNLYIDGSKVTDLVIPEGITKIKPHAFHGMSSVERVHLPEGLLSIGEGAFDAINWSAEINIPSTVVEMGAYAIYPYRVHYNAINCTTMAANAITYGNPLVIGEHVQVLPNNLITNNTNKIKMQGLPPTADEVAFVRLQSDAQIQVPCELEQAYRDADVWGDLPNLVATNTYTISLGTMEHGYAWVSVEATCTQPAIVYAQPDDNYSFSHWSDGNTDNPRTIMPTQDTQFVALFATPTCVSMTGGIEACYVPNGRGLTLSSINGQIQGTFTVPDSVMFDGEMKPVNVIGEHAFESQTMSVINLHAGIDSIGYAAFNNCPGLTRVNYSGTIADWCHIGFASEFSNPLIYADNLYIDGSMVTDLVIPEGITKIKPYAFLGMNSVESVQLPEGLLSIGESAFDLINLSAEINIPSTVVEIGEHAIYPYRVHYNAINCTTMAANAIPNGNPLVIGEQVQAIPNNLITNNTIRTKMQGLPPTADEIAFVRLRSDAQIQVPCELEQAYRDADVWSDLPNLVVTNTYTISFGEMENGYAGVEQEATCTQPAVVHAQPTDNYSFLRWSDGNTDNPRTITPTQDTQLVALFAAPTCISMTGGVEACYVYNGSGMTLTSITGQIQGSFTVPDSVMFDGETQPVNIIGGYTFESQTLMSVINLHAEIDSIGYGAFNNCPGLARVNYSGTIVDWCHIGFGDWNSNPLSYADNLYIDGSMVTELVIPEGITKIKPYAFYGMNCMERVQLPEGLLSIGERAFSDINWNAEINIPSTVVEIGAYAIYPYRVHYNAINCTTMAANAIPNGNPLVIGEQVQVLPNNLITNYTYEIRMQGVPPTADEVAFVRLRSDAQIQVPCELEQAYHDADVWGDLPNLVAANNYTISFGAMEHGAAVVEQNATCTQPAVVYAWSDQGWHFAQWSDGSSERTYYLNLTQDTIITPIFVRDTYYIDCQILSSTACGSVQGTGYYISDSLVILIATANYGYHFTGWSNGETADQLSFIATGDMTVDAYFAPNLYSVSLKVADSTMGGYVSIDSQEWSDDATQMTIEYDATVQIIATPMYGYRFVAWSDGDSSDVRDVHVLGDTTFYAIFARLPFSVSGIAITNGRDDSDPCSVIGSCTVPYETPVTLTAQPGYGYHFSGWSDGTTENPHTIIATSDIILQAIFEPNTYTIDANSDNEDYGMVNQWGVNQYHDTVWIEAEANYGYHFEQWNDGNTDNPRSIVVEGDSSITALFAPNVYTLTLASNDDSLGSVDGAGSFLYLDTATIVATTTAEHYHFVRWSDGVAQPTRTIVIDKDSTLTAIFAIDTMHLATIVQLGTAEGIHDDATCGEVLPEGYYPYGASVTLTAIANEDFHFAEWDNGDRSATRTIVITQDTVITAIFTDDVVPHLCMVSVQNGHNTLTWTKSHAVESYNIYREGTSSGLYDLVASVAGDSLSMWVDSASSPTTRSYRYKMTATDIYGYESDFDIIHKTMHLTISRGIGNRWNLVWTEYEGTDYTTYVIYRGTDASNIEEIDRMPAGGNTTYTDNNAPDGDVYYQVGIILTNPCYATKANSISLSNIATNSTTGIGEVTADGVKISGRGGKITITGAEGMTIEIIDITGRRIPTSPTSNNGDIKVNVATGVYLVRVGSNTVRKVVVTR